MQAMAPARGAGLPHEQSVLGSTHIYAPRPLWRWAASRGSGLAPDGLVCWT
jgi:hypothetical protein